MNILDLFRPNRSARDRRERDARRSEPQARPRPISGTQPGQEREMQRHRGRRTAGETPMRRTRSNRRQASTASTKSPRTARPARGARASHPRPTARKTARRTCRGTVSRRR